MHRAMIAAGFAAILVIGAAAPAFAGYGALAYDEAASKYGLSSNEQSQSKADDVAMKICGGGGTCKIIFRTAARQCGAVAMAETGNGWGGGKGPQRAAAELGAMTNCQKHTKGQCKVREWACNR
jgi:uncharacterized protein DUF4189